MARAKQEFSEGGAHDAKTLALMFYGKKILAGLERNPCGKKTLPGTGEGGGREHRASSARGAGR